MVELVTGHHTAYAPGKAQGPTMTRRYSEDDRMAGSVPVWHHSASTVTSRDIPLSNALSASDTGRNNTTAPSLSFGEILDIVNPLHHLPVVGGLYRKLTGDDISPVARIAGGGLYGGPVGAAVALANAAIEEHSGQDLTGNVISAFSGEVTGNHDAPEIKLGRVMEDPRMAGGNSFRLDSQSRTAGHAASFAPTGHPVQIPPEPAAQGRSAGEKIIADETGSGTLLDTMPPREPVTRVHISENTHSRQVWKFNT